MKSFAKLKDLAFSHKNYTTIFMAKSIETEKSLKQTNTRKYGILVNKCYNNHNVENNRVMTV